jgi:hypothetical protein
VTPGQELTSAVTQAKAVHAKLATAIRRAERAR